MKRLILAATVISASLLPFTCSANADSLGINKDCDNHPVSQYGMDTITAFSQYKTESKKFKDALTAFCNKGKTMGDMGFEAANAHSLAEARKWTDSSLPGGNEEQKKFSAAMGSLLHYAMLNGFSGFDYPRPPEQKEKPVSSFNPNEICDDISSKAAKYSTSNLPPQVQISLAEWNQIKGEFQMVCFAGIMAGNNRQSVDSKILAGMNDLPTLSGDSGAVLTLSALPVMHHAQRQSQWQCKAMTKAKITPKPHTGSQRSRCKQNTRCCINKQSCNCQAYAPSHTGTPLFRPVYCICTAI
ncbi:TPA: hypothetical protein L1169_004725 [Escherichia coli]|uniref:hypothetical protein n=1 Tax=Escherichia coli TaxID=562 RepID=UPI003F42EC20|nr:hypothetical protein [Escherichia coli]